MTDLSPSELEKKRAKKREYQNRYNRKKRGEEVYKITTEFLEKELMKKYQLDNDAEKKDILKYMIEIWKYKHKVPHSDADTEEIDLGVNPNGTSEPVFTE